MNRALVQELVSPLTLSLGSDKTRVSLALAVSLAYILPVPTQRSKNAELFFVENYMTKVNRFVSAFNERFLIETETVSDAVRTIWQTRYQYVYLPGVADMLAMNKKACPIADYLAGFNLDAETTDKVCATAIALMPKLEALWTPEA